MKDNHTVPDCLLKQWISGQPPRIHYLDCCRGNVKTKQGTSFATSPFLYVPELPNGGRDETLERWFGVDETALGLLLEAVAQGTFGTKLSYKTQIQAIRACIVLGLRSEFEFKWAKHAIAALAPDAQACAVDRCVIESARDQFNLAIEKFLPWEYTVFHGSPTPLLICDRPMFDMTWRGFDALVMPISPTAFLAGKCPTNSDASPLAWKPLQGPDAAAELNEMSVVRARTFLVGDDATLKSLEPRFTAAEMAERRAKDSLTILKFPQAPLS